MVLGGELNERDSTAGRREAFHFKTRTRLCVRLRAFVVVYVNTSDFAPAKYPARPGSLVELPERTSLGINRSFFSRIAPPQGKSRQLRADQMHPSACEPSRNRGGAILWSVGRVT
jgi:hypothetical protein